MKYSTVYIEALGYELAPHVITTTELENRLKPFYDAVGFQMGQLEVLTGIRERRFWDVEHTLAQGAALAGRKALDKGGVAPEDVGALVFCGVGQDGFEPATACSVADDLGIGNTAHVYDVSNACLGMITGMVEVANAIQLGQIRAGLVVSCETARQIVDATIEEINREKSADFYALTIATLTGGSGAAAILLTDGTLGNGAHRHAVKGGVVRHDNRFHDLCRWTFDQPGMPTHATVQIRTHAKGVLENGLALAKKTFEAFTREMEIPGERPDKYICHQVGALHQRMFLQTMNIDPETDYATFPTLGNMGTVSLPMTAAIADEKEFLKKGEYVGFLGIGSGLNCLMLGIEW